MKTFILIFCLLIMGCETLPQPPDKGAVYRTANETYTVENTTYEDCSDNFYYDENIENIEYNPGNNVLITWTRD